MKQAMKQTVKNIILFSSICTLIIYLCLSTIFLPSSLTSAKEITKGNTKETTKSPTATSYIALGDSITLGTGLTKDEKNFPSILYNYLKEETPNLVFQNYGKNGDTIIDITKKVNKKEVKQKLKTASVVTLTAGGNDVIQLTAAAAEKYTGKDFKKSNSIPSFVKNETTSRLLLSYLKKDSIQKELANFLEEFETNFRTLLKAIKKEAPNATIVVQTIYNPASGSEYESLAKCIDVVLPKTNEIIKKVVEEENKRNPPSKGKHSGHITTSKKVANESKILLLDTYHLFDQQAPIYVRVEDDDIHPTQAGHRLIANQIMILLENQKILKTGQLSKNTKPVATTNVRSTNSDEYQRKALTFISVGFILGLFILCLATVIGEIYHRRKAMKEYK